MSVFDSFFYTKNVMPSSEINSVKCLLKSFDNPLEEKRGINDKRVELCTNGPAAETHASLVGVHFP